MGKGYSKEETREGIVIAQTGGTTNVDTHLANQTMMLIAVMCIFAFVFIVWVWIKIKNQLATWLQKQIGGTPPPAARASPDAASAFPV